MEPSAWVYNWATLFQMILLQGPGPPETVKYGHESRGTRTRHPSFRQRVLHKDYNRMCLVEKKWSWVSRGLARRRTDWRLTASRKGTVTDSVAVRAEGWQFS
jgi:hypothetical protein